MTAHEVAERFGRLESQIAEEKGGFSLFALFMLEEVPDRWDLIVSAPWIGEDTDGAIDYFVAEIKAKLSEHDLIALSRIVVIDPEDPGVQALNRAIQIEHGEIELRDRTFFGLPVKQAYFITSKRPPAPAAA